MSPPNSRPTMRDIARSVGVSVASVSRVLNGEGGASPATAARIFDAVERLGYRRNDLAHDLRNGTRTSTIGLVLRDPGTRFYSGLIRGINDAVAQRGLLVLTASALTPEREREVVLRLCARRVDGLLIVPQATEHRYLRQEQQVGVPIVFIDRPSADLTADVALLDNVGGALAGVAHLLRGGHRRIAFIGGRPDTFTIAQRLKGWEQAHADLGLSADPALVRLNRHDEVDAAAAASELLALSDPPTAFFTANNRATAGVARALHTSRETRAVVGFDDLDLADLVDPPLSVVAYDSHDLGHRAARLLLQRIDGEDEPPRRVVVPTMLVVRGSGEIPPEGGPGRPLPEPALRRPPAGTTVAPAT